MNSARALSLSADYWISTLITPTSPTSYATGWTIKNLISIPNERNTRLFSPSSPAQISDLPSFLPIYTRKWSGKVVTTSFHLHLVPKCTEYYSYTYTVPCFMVGFGAKLSFFVFGIPVWKTELRKWLCSQNAGGSQADQSSFWTDICS